MAADALFFGAHPDDIELTSGGLAARLASHGHRVVLVDLTRGEGASRGVPEQRAREAAEAARILGVAERVNLGLADCGLSRHDRSQLALIVTCVRTHRPALVVAPDRDDAHPDHVEAHHLVSRACYLAGLARYPASGERHRPARLMYALYRGAARAQLVVDVTGVWEKRQAAIAAHASQFDPAAGPATYLTDPLFAVELEARARIWGASIGAAFGEGYRMCGPVPVADARSLLARVAGNDR
ncbi:MAG: bacillithiol biosynthesis deacetylase BshB1 [Candidatus Eisenbacteria bacterium]|nr:bacillithiol biosynthesis deacetylase BshB1 [Candidatus Eisenbacteria bacterium]